MADANRPAAGFFTWLEANQGKLLPLTMLGAVVIIAIPLPSWVMDVLLSLNIAIAVTILLTALSLGKPTEFSVFPTILLSTTLFRLVLNLATTRLILTRAATDQTLAAGHVVATFADFVAGGNLAVGIVLFLILFVIQFAVITKGAMRISEVQARFALDAMPGKQLAIDADLSAGVIDETQARKRREEVAKTADFYAAMDGASKFVQGDNLASVFITLLNIFGGLAIGVLWYQMEIAEAGRIFSLLTIGDGLASQIPALLSSMATGVLITRQSSDVDLGREINRQLLFTNTDVLKTAGGFLGLAGVTGLLGTGLPVLPLVSIAAGCFFLARRIDQSKRLDEIQKKAQPAQSSAPKAPADKEQRLTDVLRTEPLVLEMGLEILPIADPSQGGQLPDRLHAVRETIARELGIVTPKFRVIDNSSLRPANTYRLLLRNVVVAQSSLRLDKLLVLATDPSVEQSVPGEPASEPLRGARAIWIDVQNRRMAERYTNAILTPIEVIGSHIADTLRRYAPEFLNRELTNSLINRVKESSPQTVAELIPDVLKVGDVQRVLQNLLRERVCIRDMELILEALADNAGRTKDSDMLTELVRHRLSRTICERVKDSKGVIHAITLEPALQEFVQRGLVGNDIRTINLPMQTRQRFLDAVQAKLRIVGVRTKSQTLLVSGQIRLGIRNLIAERFPNVHVLAFHEIPRDVQTESADLIKLEDVETRAMAHA